MDNIQLNEGTNNYGLTDSNDDNNDNNDTLNDQLNINDIIERYALIKDLPFYQNLVDYIETTINFKLKENFDSLLYEIYNFSTLKEQKLLKDKLTPELLESVFPKVTIELSQEFEKNKKKKIEINPGKRCMARIGEGEQCSRSQTDNAEYCRGHLNNLTYGRIDGPLEGKALRTTKPRKKTQRTVKNYNIDNINLDEYIKTTVIALGEEEYLIDEWGIVYSFDRDNVIVGKVENDSIYWVS